jgi:hypothetical protein
MLGGNFVPVYTHDVLAVQAIKAAAAVKTSYIGVVLRVYYIPQIYDNVSFGSCEETAVRYDKVPSRYVIFVACFA